ncbi:hypothetical protein [Anaeromicropila populeti]|uniref:Uncharacterized protein n=1 Tax=Anaeromicropila populeti TaxID=37658 RepID=A0A1I6LBU4_9FIRM|nr:hypothetical protein [Anaeromicropila populeti]SFS00936.1 hypothetical protein SAMN05661086_03196 [Anaeromicropila populeti]
MDLAIKVIFIVISSIFFMLAHIVPKYSIKYKRNNRKKNVAAEVESMIRDVFLLRSFKVINHEKAIDDVYERMSKYNTSFRI